MLGKKIHSFKVHAKLKYRLRIKYRLTITKNDGVQSTVKEKVQNIVIHVTYQCNNIFYKIKLKTGYAFVLRKTKEELVIYSIKYFMYNFIPTFHYLHHK